MDLKREINDSGAGRRARPAAEPEIPQPSSTLSLPNLKDLHGIHGIASVIASPALSKIRKAPKAKKAHVFSRDIDDFYVEPPEAVSALLAVERFTGGIWDPACGSGNVVTVCRSKGFVAVGTDKVIRKSGFSQHDFLSGRDLQEPHACENIMTNPPFTVACAFVETALRSVTGKVAVLNRLAWLEGQERSGWFARMPLAHVWVFPWRLNMPPGAYTGTRKGGSVAFAWYVFEPDHQTAPEIGWLPIPDERRARAA